MASKQDIEAGAAFIRLFLKDEMTGPLRKSLNALGSTLNQTGSAIAKVGAGITAAGAAILAPLTAAINHFSEAGDALDKLAARTGVSASTWVEFGHAADASGTSVEDIERSIRKMQATLGDAATGSKSAAKALNQLGLSAVDLKSLKPEEQFQAIADRIAAIEDPTMKAAAAMEVFGKSGTMLLPMLSDLRELRKEARGLGLVPSEKAVKDAAAVNDALGRVVAVVKALAFEIGASLADEVLALAEASKVVLVTVGQWIKANIGLVKIIAGVGITLAAMGAAVTVVGGTIIATGLILKGFAVAIGAIGAAVAYVSSVIAGALAAAVAFIASPIGIIVAALGASVVVWAMFTESGQKAINTIKGLLGDLFRVARETFGGIVDSLKSGDIRLAGEIAFLGLKLAALEGLLALRALVGDTITSIAGKLLNGDLSGAWGEVLQNLGAMWQTFSTYVVDTVVSMSTAVIQAWQKAVTFIANKILDIASLPGFNKIFEFVSGVDLKAEIERGNKLDNDLASRGLGGNKKDPLDAAKATAKSDIDAKARSMMGAIDTLNAVNKTAAELAAKARGDAGKTADDGITALLRDFAKTKADLDSKRNAAAAKAGAAGASGAAVSIDEAGNLKGASNARNLITFSAASAVAAGYQGSAMSAERKTQEEVLGHTKRIAERLERGVNTLERLASGLTYGA